MKSPRAETTAPSTATKRSIKHSFFGIRLFIRAGTVINVEADLSKPLLNDIENDASLDQVHELLALLSYPTEVPETLRRLDVAMNLAFDNFEAVLRTFRQNHHP